MGEGQGNLRWLALAAIMGAILGACKLLMLARSRRPAPLWRRLAFLAAWIGMDAEAFLHGRGERPRAWAWCEPAAFLALGLLLIGAVVPALNGCGPHGPVWAGAAAMLGLLCCFHFGLFQLLSCLWRLAGVEAAPIMRAPWRADGLVDFWSRRWNMAFRDIMHPWLLVPVMRRFGTGWAMAAVFLASGLLHELVITVPAGAGYGLPTLYFALQGVAQAVERRHRHGWLAPAWRRRLLLWACVLGPALVLFPPVFLTRVILPFALAAAKLLPFHGAFPC